MTINVEQHSSTLEDITILTIIETACMDAATRAISSIANQETTENGECSSLAMWVMENSVSAFFREPGCGLVCIFHVGSRTRDNY